MEDLLENIETHNHSNASNIADKLIDELLDQLENSDEPICGHEEEWAEVTTKADVYAILHARLKGPTSVCFKSVRRYDDISFERPEEKEEVNIEKINEYESRGTYKLTCPTCYGTDTVSKVHGNNAYLQCSECGTGIIF